MDFSFPPIFHFHFFLYILFFCSLGFLTWFGTWKYNLGTLLKCSDLLLAACTASYWILRKHVQKCWDLYILSSIYICFVLNSPWPLSLISLISLYLFNLCIYACVVIEKLGKNKKGPMETTKLNTKQSDEDKGKRLKTQYLPTKKAIYSDRVSSTTNIPTYANYS